MKLELTMSELKTLTEMAYVSDWVANSRSARGESDFEDFDELRKKIYKLALDSDISEWIEKDEQLNDFFETKEFEDHIEDKGMLFLHEIDSFWENLASGLGERYLREKFGEKGLEELDPEVKFQKIESIREQLLKVFEKKGLDVLHFEGVLRY